MGGSFNSVPVVTASVPGGLPAGVGPGGGSASGLAASFALHMGLMALLLLLPMAAPPAPPVESVPVEIVSLPPPAEAPPPETAKPETSRPPPTAAAPPAQPGLIPATTLFSASALAAPGSRQARQVMPFLSPEEQHVQLCNLEAVEQVAHWRPALHPERIIAYAMAALIIAGGIITAPGAAFFSHEAWYGLAFRCALSADGHSVTAFAFAVRDAIPKSAWEDHGLPEHP